jgi:DNA-directed RNA polymerase specialized sigma24 family protein
LAWLNPSREAAGQKYEVIRARLIKIFVNRGCADAEGLADLTINRVITRLPTIRESYVGDPAYYFCGVARNIYLESMRRKEVATDFFPTVARTETALDSLRECLRECLEILPSDQRELVLEYYLNQKRAKIEHRKCLAEELGLTSNALRLRAHRIRTILEKCVRQCIGS